MPGNNLKLEPWGKDDPTKDESLPQVPGATNDKASNAWQRAGSPASCGQGGADFDEPPSPRARSPNLHKRMVLNNRDKESLLEEIIDLKKALSDQAYHLRLHKVHASAVQIENRKLEKDIEDLEVSGSYEAPRTGGPTRLRSKLQGLKVRLGDLQATCDLQHDELCALRRDIRVTRIREVEVERDIYAGEIGRLQKVVRRLKILSARITLQNRELQRLKDKAARLELANQRLESCIAVVHKTLERANKEVTSYRAKASESQLEAKKYNKKIIELQEHAVVLEGLLEKERIEKRKIAQRIKTVGVKKREWDKEFQAKQKRNQLASADAFRKKKKKKKKKLKSKRKDKEGDVSGASSTSVGETSVESSSDSDESSHGQISYEEFEARKLSFLNKVETASHSFIAQEKDVYGEVVNRTLPSGALGSHGYGSGGPYGGASGESGSTFGPKGGLGGHGSSGQGGYGRGDYAGLGGQGGYGHGSHGGTGEGGPGGYNASGNVSGGYKGLGGEGGPGENRAGYGRTAETGSRGYDARDYGEPGNEGRSRGYNVEEYRPGSHGQGNQGGYSSEGEVGSQDGIKKGGKVGKAGKDGKRGKSGKSGPNTTSTSDYGSSGGEQRSATGTLSSGSDSSLLLSPEDKKREEDLEGTFYEGVDTAAEEFMDSVEAMVGGTSKVPKLNLERIKAREAIEAKRREEQKLRRETEERLHAQEQEGKRLVAELAEERRLIAQKVEAETQRRLKLITTQGNLEIEIDHEKLQSDEFESQIKTDTGGRLSLQINLKRSSEHPYLGSPRGQAEAEVEAEQQKEVEDQKEEARRMKAEIEAREEAVKKAERDSMLRQEEQKRKELIRQQQEVMHEAELRKKAEDDVQKKMAQEAAAKIAAEEGAKVLAWVGTLTPEQLEEYRRRAAMGENPVEIMKSMQMAAKLKAWEGTLTPEQLEEYRRRVVAGEDPVEVMKLMHLAAKIKAWEATLTPEQLQEFRSRVLAGENPEDVMKMMQWESTLTPEQLVEFRRRVANGENPNDVMKSMQLSAFEATLTPEELAEYQRRIALGEDPYAIMQAMMAIKKKKNPFQFLDKDMQGFIKENIRGVLGHLENITEVIVHKQEELGMHKEAASTTTGAAIDVLKASEREADKKKRKKKEVHIQEQEESSNTSGTPRKERKGESSKGAHK